MNETIITAVISGLCVAIPSVLASYFQNQSTIKLMDYRLGRLEERVDQHNHFNERIVSLEEKVDVANHRISDLERI